MTSTLAPCLTVFGALVLVAVLRLAQTGIALVPLARRLGLASAG